VTNGCPNLAFQANTFGYCLLRRAVTSGYENDAFQAGGKNEMSSLLLKSYKLTQKKYCVFFLIYPN
jgi:hypothetical protein